MACRLLLGRAPLLLLAVTVGCAGGEPATSFTSGAMTFGPGETGDSSDPTGPDDATSGPGATGAGSGGMDTGTPTPPDPDSGPADTGMPPDPDTGDSGPGCLPSPEVCDGLDNDCDGAADNGDPEGGEACSTGMPGVCAEGTTECVSGSVVCNPDELASAESCDGLDNDCNGSVDEGNPGGGGACGTGMPGACSAGTNVCQGGALTCVGNQMPSTESCDGTDNDCDGQTDEGNPGGGGACNTGLLGVCGPGTNNCVGGSLTCQQNVLPSPEVCGNGADDDCDGAVDDGCGCPFGLCQTPGLPMINGCDPCVSSVCASDPFCCNTQWDSICVNEVETICGQADCVSASCAHLVCVTGTALTAGCHTCVTSICAVDPFCCSTSWDGLCVGQVATVCGLAC